MVCLAIAAIVVRIHLLFNAFSVRFRLVETWNLQCKQFLANQNDVMRSIHLSLPWHTSQLHLTHSFIAKMSRQLEVRTQSENRSPSPEVSLSVATSPSKLVKVRFKLNFHSASPSHHATRTGYLLFFSFEAEVRELWRKLLDIMNQEEDNPETVGLLPKWSRINNIDPGNRWGNRGHQLWPPVCHTLLSVAATQWLYRRYYWAGN